MSRLSESLARSWTCGKEVPLHNLNCMKKPWTGYQGMTSFSVALLRRPGATQLSVCTDFLGGGWRAHKIHSPPEMKMSGPSSSSQIKKAQPFFFCIQISDKQVVPEKFKYHIKVVLFWQFNKRWNHHILLSHYTQIEISQAVSCSVDCRHSYLVLASNLLQSNPLL